MEELQTRWKYLYSEYLPALAKAKDPSQKTWPVHLDHCFARIILDNAVGVDKPWTEVIKAPAIKNMSQSELESAIKLAEQIANGEANLAELDDRSLELRGKSKKRKAKDEVKPEAKLKKQKKESSTISSYFMAPPSPNKPKEDTDNSDPPQNIKQEKADMSAELKRISDSDITAFRKLTLSLLCQVPRGRYSTYGAMSDWISENCHKTCARAVGNAMRNNPFAPEVPCHRILATGGTLGGFNGSWGEDGKFAKQKHDLLREEGVRFDSNRKAKGPPFRDFEKVL